MTIGIVCRIDKTNNNIVYVFNKEICDYILNKNFTVLPIISYDFNLINKCDGFILPGGDNKTIDNLIIRYAYNNDIPILGICLGMQSMGEYFGGKLIPIKNHNSKESYAHKITIDEDSKLYNILKIKKLTVNSRHNYKLINSSLKISSYNDETIESIEDNTKKFFIGVQWHPESRLNYDIYSKKLFDSFLTKCKENEQ